jgi:hypothetical protein
VLLLLLLLRFATGTVHLHVIALLAVGGLLGLSGWLRIALHT